jgi:hypothetical protein
MPLPSVDSRYCPSIAVEVVLWCVLPFAEYPRPPMSPFSPFATD